MTQQQACVRNTAAPPRISPTGVTQVVDLEAAAHSWEAGPGVVVHGYGFNGQVPGPTIEATTGDTLAVRFTNRLPEPTSIHWHGLRIPAAMDGAHAGVAVQPGDSFEYRFDLADAGTFWYHPHVAETTHLERGLCGALIVRHRDEPGLEERLLVFDDVKMGPRGYVAPPTPVLEDMRGREGNLLLVNGTAAAHMQVTAGQLERWRLVNAASARYLRLSLAGHPFTLVGSDGGPLAAPVRVQEVLLAPGDRLDALVGPFPPHQTPALDALPYRRGAGRPRTHRLATLHVDGIDMTADTGHVDLTRLTRVIEPLADAAADPTRTIRLGGRLTRHGVEGLINGTPQLGDEPVRVGELQVWEVVNETSMDHPFHLHGFFFQVLDISGAPPPYLSWEDTINVPARGRVRIAWLPDDRPGVWMYHCHILEHQAVDMIGHFEVVP